MPAQQERHSFSEGGLAVARHREFGIETGPIAIDMAGVYARKREVSDGIIQVHLNKYQAGDELILGDGTFVAPRTWLFVAPRVGFGLICAALILHLRPEARGLTNR
jgi:hypothetical protein